ncbi:MAG TPA: DUF2842 domain-containing protein [Vitreimonas sp.]|jgi:basic membrane lipoprotein Med (substrate-binding protein (PBP1-ABC) superfamily)|nr:DUF2842 domain-containing protein [Vitreimonas sp.]
MDVRARKAIGCAVLLGYLALYTIAAATLGGIVGAHAPQLVLVLYYAVAGIAWVAPLKPLFAWMNGQTPR